MKEESLAGLTLSAVSHYLCPKDETTRFCLSRTLAVATRPLFNVDRAFVIDIPAKRIGAY